MCRAGDASKGFPIQMGMHVPWSTSCPTAHRNKLLFSHPAVLCRTWPSTKECDAHIFPTVPATAFTSPEPNQGSSSIWCQQGGVCAGPAAALGKVRCRGIARNIYRRAMGLG